MHWNLSKLERCICENKAFAIIQRMQAGLSTLIKKDGSEMLVAMVLDKPLADAQALVGDPPKLMAEILQIMQDKRMMSKYIFTMASFGPTVHNANVPR